MIKLILFDIDYTLTKGSWAHKAAIVEGIKEVFNINAPIEKLKLHGMTDQQIITDLLKISGIEYALINKNMNKCIKAIIQSYNRHKSQDTVALIPGVKSLLEYLSKQKGIILGLVTGNIESIAFGKLSLVNISHYFQVGGFGSDHLKRSKLVEIAVDRAKKKFSIDKVKAFVVGDTPKDIMAAKEANTFSIGVATGSFSKKELEKSGADLVLESFLEKEKFIEFINSC